MKKYYTYRHKSSGDESKHYLTVGGAKAALTNVEKHQRRFNTSFLKSDYEIVTYECVEVAVTQLQ